MGGGFRGFGRCPKENVFFKLRSSLIAYLPLICQRVTCPIHTCRAERKVFTYPALLVQGGRWWFGFGFNFEIDYLGIYSSLCTQAGPWSDQGCIFRLTCSHHELTRDHVLTSAYVKIFRTVTRNAVNRGVWRKTDCSWLSLNKHAMNIWLSSLRIRAHLSWRTGKHLHVLHVLRTYSTYSHSGW